VKQREPRQEVRVSARIKTDEGWGDAQILNISSRGAMAASLSPPSRGTYVEIRRGTYSIVGRVMWRSGGRFGLMAQDQIEVSALTAVKPPSSVIGERRSAARPIERPRALSISEREEASRRFAKMFDWVAIAAVAVGAAVFIGQTVETVLSKPMQSVGAALGTNP
jgi:hypothetical protein